MADRAPSRAYSDKQDNPHNYRRARTDQDILPSRQAQAASVNMAKVPNSHPAVQSDPLYRVPAFCIPVSAPAVWAFHSRRVP
jgi:hypothetical protein